MSSNEKIVVFGPALPMNLAPMWVAHDKGFFKEEGLDEDDRRFFTDARDGLRHLRLLFGLDRGADGGGASEYALYQI